MSNSLRYMMDLEVDEDADVEEIEKLLESLLLDLYETGDVISIKVIDKGTVKDDSFDEMIEVIDGLDNVSIMRAIDSVKELEREEDEYDD